MKIVTDKVYPNEPAHGLFEGPRHGRWVQAVYVVRGDAIAEHLTDLGPETDFALVMPILIPNDGDDSVAALQYLAEQNRHDSYWMNRRREMLAESTLIKDVMQQIDEKAAYQQNRSVLGPSVSTQRNEYPRQFAESQARERIRNAGRS